jgi:DNA mismatch endonuclease (patch repair protein)
MSNISGKETKPEIIVRKYLFSRGLRFRKNDKRYPGTPDIVLPKFNTIVFVHGCFWHGHKDCKKSSLPKTRSEFWKKKINQNKSRDQKNIHRLYEKGWSVEVIWECMIIKKSTQEIHLKSLYKKIKEGNKRKI